MQKAKEMQENMKKIQENQMNIETTGESGAGLVIIKMNGKYNVKNIKIDSSLLKEEKEIMEDLIVAAINNAVQKIEEKKNDNIKKYGTQMNLPFDFKLPF